MESREIAFKVRTMNFVTMKPKFPKYVITTGTKKSNWQLTYLKKKHGVTDALEKATKGYIILVGVFSILQIDYTDALIDMAQGMYVEQLGIQSASNLAENYGVWWRHL